MNSYGKNAPKRRLITAKFNGDWYARALGPKPGANAAGVGFVHSGPRSLFDRDVVAQKYANARATAGNMSAQYYREKEDGTRELMVGQFEHGGVIKSTDATGHVRNVDGDILGQGISQTRQIEAQIDRRMAILIECGTTDMQSFYYGFDCEKWMAKNMAPPGMEKRMPEELMKADGRMDTMRWSSQRDLRAGTMKNRWVMGLVMPDIDDSSSLWQQMMNNPSAPAGVADALYSAEVRAPAATTSGS
jgi:hypothetical protein